MTHANSQPEKQILTDKELELFELARKVLNYQIQDVYDDEENCRREKEYYWSVKKDEIVNPHDESKNQTKIEINWQYLGRPHPFVLLSHLSTLLDLDFSMEFWRNDGLKPGILEKSDSNEIKGNITGIATFMNIYLVAEHLIENPEKKSILADLILKKLYPKQHYLEPGNRLLLEGFAPLDNGEETTEEQDTVAQLQDLGDYYYLEDDEYLKKTMFKEEKRQKIAKIMKENLIALKENQTLSPQQKLDRTRKMKEIYDQKTTQFSLPSYHLLIKKFGNPWVNVLRYNCNLHDLRDRYKLVRVEKEENNFNQIFAKKIIFGQKVPRQVWRYFEDRDILFFNPPLDCNWQGKDLPAINQPFDELPNKGLKYETILTYFLLSCKKVKLELLIDKITPPLGNTMTSEQIIISRNLPAKFRTCKGFNEACNMIAQEAIGQVIKVAGITSIERPLEELRGPDMKTGCQGNRNRKILMLEFENEGFWAMKDKSRNSNDEPSTWKKTGSKRRSSEQEKFGKQLWQPPQITKTSQKTHHDQTLKNMQTTKASICWVPPDKVVKKENEVKLNQTAESPKGWQPNVWIPPKKL